jgi:hypothetical protein
MTTQTMNAEREQLLKIANKYRNQGYEVTFHPNSEDLPSFLKNYRPDMIVRRGEETVVVEVKSRSSLSSLPPHYLSGLAEVIEKHQSWRLDLVMDNSEDDSPYPSRSEGSLQKQDIESRLAIAKQIVSQNLESSILYVWSLVEATLRLISEKEELSLKKIDPLSLVKQLTYEGIISRSDYQLLMNALALRNAVAHGFKTSQLTLNSVYELIEVTENLLKDLSSDPEC